MEYFKSLTDFESFVKQISDEYLSKTAEHLFADTNVDRFLVQLNTDLKNRGFEILNSDPAPPNDNVRARINFRLSKGVINPRRLEEYDNVIQKHIDDIEKRGE